MSKHWQYQLFHCFLFLTLLAYNVHGQCDKATASFSELSMAFQHVQGTEKTTSYAHLLATSQSKSPTTCSGINSALVLESPTTTCTIDCLVGFTPYQFTNGSDFVDIVMVKDGEASLYPGYNQGTGSIYCVPTSGYCGATIPLYNFYSSSYADHYTSSDTTMPDSTYSFENGGTPICYGWAMPTDEADKTGLANFYSEKTPTECDVYKYFGLSDSTTTSMSPSSTTSESTSTTSTSSTSTTTTSTTTTSSSTTSTSTTTTTTPKSTTTTSTTTTSPAPTTTTTILTTTTTPGTTTTTPGIPVTDSSGNTVTDATGNTVTYPPAKDDSDSGDGKKRKGFPVWAWVVLGVGLGVLVLAAIGMAYFIYSNFNSRKPVHGRVNPYDRDLYTTDGMHDVPPIPVQSMPAQTAAAPAAPGYSGIGVAESSVI